MATISLCVITKNEQSNIARCLCSVKNYVAEMIVVDTGSSDDTVSIAQSLGAKTFHYAWANDFSAARNFALDQASSDWIVFLDADEYFEQGRSANLQEVVRNIHGNRKIDVANILMKHRDGVNGPIIAHTHLVRLFRHSCLIRYQGRIHEALHKKGRRPVAIYIPESTLTIYHTGYSQSTLPEKARRNLPLLEQDLASNTMNCLTYYHLSQSYTLLRNHAQAAYYALKALEDKEGISFSNARYKPYVFYVNSMLALHLHSQDNVAAMVGEALKKYPDHPEVLYCSAIFHLKCGRYSKAFDGLLQSIAANTTYHGPLDNEFLLNIGQAYEEIAVLHDKMNHSEQYFAYIIAALKTDKYLGSSLALLLSQIRSQKPADIIQVLDHLYDVRNKKDVDFLVRNLAVLNQKLLFAHYLKLLSTQFQGDYFIGMKFLVCDRFEAAFHCFATLFGHSGPDGAELFAVIASMIADRPDWLVRLGPSANSPLRKIATAYFQVDTAADLPAVEYSSFSMLYLNFIHLSSEEQTFRLLRSSCCFLHPDELLSVIDHMIKQHMYPPVLRYCLAQLQSANNEPTLTSQLNFRVGFCCYKVKDWDRAVSFFAQALECECSRNAAAEMLAWTHQQCHNPIVRQQIASLQEKYGLDFSPIA